MLAGGSHDAAGTSAANGHTCRSPQTLALVYLSTVGAIGGFVAYTYALRHLPVSFVSLYAYINPIIAVALGVLILHESFDSRMAVAAALVFCGVAHRTMERTPDRVCRTPRCAGRAVHLNRVDGRPPRGYLSPQR